MYITNINATIKYQWNVKEGVNTFLSSKSRKPNKTCLKRLTIQNYLNALADIFEMSPHALSVPDIDSYVGLMHTLFTSEDFYRLRIREINKELCFRLDKSKGTTYLSMFDMFHVWNEQEEKLKSGESIKEKYNQ